MLFVIMAVILFFLWIVGVAVFKLTGVLIHLLLIVALVLVVMRLVRGPRAH
jgi:hypothetical protein